MITEYQFGAWLPDRVDFKNPGLEDVRNVIPGVGGYLPVREFIGTGSSISGTIIGAASVFLEDASVLVVCATTTDLHVIRSGTVTASSLSLSLPSTGAVVFEQFGSSLYATIKGGDTWVLPDVESSTAFVASAGSPPSANAMGRVGDFLLMGDLVDIDASDAPYRLRWSRFNNPQGTWDTNLASQSGAIDLDASSGPITAITGGTSGLIFQRQGISRITFTGGANVFRLDEFETNRGCIARASAVQVGDRAYYLAHDGFFVTDGTTPQPVSTGKIWKWFLATINEGFISSVQGAADYQRRCIVWSFPAGPTSALTMQVWYNWEVNEWGNAYEAIDWAVEGAQSGLSLEQVAAIYSNIDTMPISLDSPEFAAFGRNLLVFKGGELGAFTGNTLEATFTGGDIHPIPGKNSFVSEVYPLVDAAAAQVKIGARDTMQGSLRESLVSPVGPKGFAPFNVDAKYYRVSTIIPAGQEWENAFGYQVEASRSGAT